MIFLSAFFLRPYAFWIASGVAAVIYGAVGSVAWELWQHGYKWPAGVIALLALATFWKYAQVLNQEIGTAEELECEALHWILRVPGLPGRALYTFSNLGAGLLVGLSIAVPARLLDISFDASVLPGLILGGWAIRYRLRHHPVAGELTITGIRR